MSRKREGSSPHLTSSTHTRPITVEVSGQCRRCLDFFSLDVFVYRDRLCLANGPRVQWVLTPPTEPNTTHSSIYELRHRPGVCNGKVSLYGSIDELAEQVPPSARRGIVPIPEGTSVYAPSVASKRF